MKLFVLVTVVAVYILLLYTLGCSQGYVVRPIPPTPVLTAPATLQQCAAGGLVVTVGVTPYVICNGMQGGQGPIGDTGAVGPTGSTGDQGPQGSPGIDTAPISVVQFCPGTPTYPYVFPEVGFSIGGKVYAVYSALDGFLTYIPPGVYLSNAVGSSCTFTVNNDGTITN